MFAALHVLHFLNSSTGRLRLAGPEYAVLYDGRLLYSTASVADALHYIVTFYWTFHVPYPAHFTGCSALLHFLTVYVLGVASARRKPFVFNAGTSMVLARIANLTK